MDSGSNDFLKTFTVGFDLSSGMELSFDERAKSEYMFKTEHYEIW